MCMHNEVWGRAEIFPKYSAEKYHDQTMKFTPSAVGLPLFHP